METKKILFIAPLGRENLGWGFINRGTIELITQALKFYEYDTADLFYNTSAIDTLKAGDYSHVVLCGNPRWDASVDDGWLYSGLLDRLIKFRESHKFMFIDAWQGAGASFDLTSAERVKMLANSPRNIKISNKLHALEAKIITRDSDSQGICKVFALNAIQYPCSSWSGARAIKQEMRLGDQSRPFKIIVVSNMSGYAGAIEMVRAYSRTHMPVATCEADSAWCEANNLPYLQIATTQSAVMLYNQCEEVISFRLHQAIPALACGSKAYYLTVDSRGEALNPFTWRTGFGDYRLGVPMEMDNPLPDSNWWPLSLNQFFKS